jgi:hypothetical protein
MVYRKQARDKPKRQICDGDICEDSDVVSLLDSRAVILDIGDCGDLP